jgi:hypothetical protein
MYSYQNFKDQRVKDVLTVKNQSVDIPNLEVSSELLARVARFFLVQHTKIGNNILNNHKIYKITTKCAKLPQNIQNYHKIYKITTKYTKLPQNIQIGHKICQHLPLQHPPKFTQIGIFGSKTCHLATLFFARKYNSVIF